MRSLMRLAIIAGLALSGATLSAQAVKKPSEAPPPKKFPGPSASKDQPEMSKAPRDASSKFLRDPFDALYPPELVMEHQNELGLTESERQVLRQSVQQAQARFIDLQWRLSAETERLDTILREQVVGEREVLEQVDRVLALERELKRTKIALLVRIRNTLTPEQRGKLTALRQRKG
jgi:Spy/CpxP family protein refolding chaperone